MHSTKTACYLLTWKNNARAKRLQAVGASVFHMTYFLNATYALMSNFRNIFSPASSGIGDDSVALEFVLMIALQLVWADTFKVGCGASICSTVNVRGVEWSKSIVFVCNYGPGGNWITGWISYAYCFYVLRKKWKKYCCSLLYIVPSSRFPYKHGVSCSDCHWNDTCRDNLCSNKFRDAPASQSKLITWVISRAGLTIGPTAQMPGASRLNTKTLLYCFFHVFSLLTTCQNRRAFWLLRLVYRLRKLKTMAFIGFEWLKELNQTAPRFMTQ